MQLIINTDGGSRGNPGPAAIGVVISTPEKQLAEISQAIGQATNNEAEYQAVISALEWLEANQASLQATELIWKLDSKLVVEQLSKNWKIKEPRMRKLAQQCWQQLEKLNLDYQFLYVPRSENAAADALVNQALDAQAE